jgi:hypothetical protein
MQGKHSALPFGTQIRNVEDKGVLIWGGRIPNYIACCKIQGSQSATIHPREPYLGRLVRHMA